MDIEQQQPKQSLGTVHIYVASPSKDELSNPTGQQFRSSTTNTQLVNQVDQQKPPQMLVVFGYGSLLWNPDFNYVSGTVGYVNGYVRRFYQQSETHRGTQHNKGRCATLVEESGGSVWGVAYKVQGEEDIRKVSDDLANREKTLGGCIEITTLFYPRDNPGNPFEVKAYIATRENRLFHEELDMDKLANQIASARGFKGENSEYLFRTADYISKYIPEENDEHLFDLARRVRALKSED